MVKKIIALYANPGLMLITSNGGHYIVLIFFRKNKPL